MDETDGKGNGPGTRKGGPRTRRGKWRSRLNALKHGRRSRRPKAEGTDSAAFRAFRWRLERSWAPASEPERFLARRFADISWRLIQSAEEHERIFTEAADGVPGPRGWAQVFLKDEYGARLDQWMTRDEAVHREMDELIRILTRPPGRANVAPREMQELPTDPLLAELMDSLRKRAGGVIDERVSRSFERALGTFSSRLNKLT
jgi:hypothetical protein